MTAGPVPQSCSTDRWSLVAAAEGWSVGVVLTHVADGCEVFSRRLRFLLDGEPIRDTWEQLLGILIWDTTGHLDSCRRVAAPPPWTSSSARERIRTSGRTRCGGC
jgi:hypothetical protein